MNAMSRKVFNRLPALVACLALMLQAAAAFQQQSKQSTSSEPSASAQRIVGYDGQVAKMQVEQPDGESAIKAVNKTTSIMDVDLTAIDTDGDEVDRKTIVVGPHRKERINLQSLFPDLLLSDLSSIEVQVSTRPLESDDIVAQGQLAVAFFSQQNPVWKNYPLGTCPRTTIGSAGCLLCCVTMAGARTIANFDPGRLNTWLTNNGGYASSSPSTPTSKCLVIHSVAANYDGPGGFTFIGTGTVSSASNLKSLIDNGKFPIATSTRFSSGHFGIIIGYDGSGTRLGDFYYLDPMDITAVFRRVGDNFVKSTSSTRIYR